MSGAAAARAGTRRVLAFSAALLVLAAFGASGASAARRYGEAFIQRFKLNEQQVAELERLRDLRIAAKDEERALRHAALRIAHSETLDEKELARVADELAAAIRAQVLRESPLIHRFYLSLDEEQRGKWVAHETRDGGRRDPAEKRGKAAAPQGGPRPD